MLKKELAIRNLDRVKVSIGAPPITHVMYVNDIILFSKATRRNAQDIVN